MNVTELNGTHLGSKVTVTMGDASVTGILTGVNHEADVITDLRYLGGSTYSVGGKHVVLKFIHAGEVRASSMATVEVHEDGH